MSDLPHPLTPAESDLRGLPFMPLDVVRLGDSDLVALSTGDEFKAAVLLWSKSWLQVPAGSLPDDDRILAHLSCAGARWPKVKQMALRGWVKCSDGRLYHSVIAPKACDAWKARLAQRERAAKRRSGKAAAVVDTPPEAQPDESHGDATASPVAHATACPVAMQGIGRGRGIVKEKEEVPVASLPRASDGCDEAVSAWNRMADRAGLSRVAKLTDQRRRHLRQRLADCGGLDGWDDALQRVTESPFLLGESRGGWKADFDFLMQASSFVKLMEGAYGNRGAGQRAQASASNLDWMHAELVQTGVIEEPIH